MEINNQLTKTTLSVLDKLLAYDENIIIGGSVGLCATGLLSRAVGDIDCILSSDVIHPDYSKIDGYSMCDESEASHAIEIKGHRIGNRNQCCIDGVKICLFTVPKSYAKYKYLNFYGRDIRMSHPKYAIQAKLGYIEKGGKSVNKHINDMEYISRLIDVNNIDNLFLDYKELSTRTIQAIF